ncbi:MAG: formylglycine-generating enzyme family protein [Fimbriimonadaceae bacterium]
MLALGILISVPIGSSQEPPKLEPFEETLPNSVVKIKMIPIPGGTIKIGAKTVTVKPFWMASTETPWEAFDAFLASGEPSPPYDQTDFPPDAVARPSKTYVLPDRGWGHAGYPAISLTFTSAQMFARWVSVSTKKKYRLPTEAEWEMAARAGALGTPDKALLDRSAWYGANSGGMTHPVGKKEPNKYGLFDMLGNAGEWATDLDGKPVLCGGIFSDKAEAVTPGMRRKWSPKWQETDPQIPKSRWWLSDGPFAGFRLVREP